MTPIGVEHVEHDGYADQEPAAVARQLADAALTAAYVLGPPAARGLEPDSE